MTTDSLEEILKDDIKQVIVIRRDLKCRRGKEVSQGSHSAMMFMTTQVTGKPTEDKWGNTGYLIELTEDAVKWMRRGFKKVTCQVSSEEELQEIYDKAKAAGLIVHMVIDEGLTEFGGVHTKTALCVGPNKSSEMAEVTDHLKLY
jgi:PTH2 family peptidyl-tRNA hydrolase